MIFHSEPNLDLFLPIKLYQMDGWMMGCPVPVSMISHFSSMDGWIDEQWDVYYL